MKNKNIYLHNNFYKEWIQYLIPIYKLNDKKIYKDYCKIKFFLQKYNFNNKIYNILYNKLHFNINNIYTSIYIYNYDILYVKIIFNKKYLNYFDYPILKYIFELPLIDLNKFKKIKNFIIFDKNIIDLWEKYNGIYMFDYVLSKPSNKIIYYELYKKIITKFIDQ